ncbi:FadR/GntR family transcriptional regulator [Sciscionella marina]|uniref:FadR/GntR family transcriptional regulator n=1 Tax=Sciscionella marina TaxID=508770 RepID=UPI000378F01D|nr:GntR family transcriptional regulator [Sciscionella marina]
MTESAARSAVFAPLEQRGRAETVAKRLTDAISLGLLEDGEQLPSESELAARFGVSTVTIREALTALRQQELVETRRGRGGGSFVRTPADRAKATVRARLREMTLAEIRDIGDEYSAIAGTAARLAAERASAEDIARIGTSVDELGSGESGVQRAERAFHLEVAASGQSPRLTQLEVRLQGEFGALLWLPTSEQGALRTAREAHTAIAAAIADADGPRARELTEKHVLEAIEQLAELHMRLCTT